MKFTDRNIELNALEKVVNRSGSTKFMIIIHGERRLGKTRLVQEILKRYNGFYFFISDKKNSWLQLEELGDTVFRKSKVRFKSWSDFFKYVFTTPGIFVFDEVQNFETTYPAAFSEMQKYFDKYKEKPGLIILISSEHSYHEKLTGEHGPLHGRLQLKIKLKPMNFKNARKMIQEISKKDIKKEIELYSLFGGYPKYYIIIEDLNIGNKDTMEIIRDLYFDDLAPLDSEVEDLMSLNFKSNRNVYFSVLEAIATGHTKFGEICGYANLDSSKLTPYLKNLIDVYGFVEAEEPILGKNTKRTYKIKNQVINFWFKYINRNQSMYELDKHLVFEKVKRDINRGIFGFGFEQVCTQAVQEQIRNGNWNYEKVGRQWGKLSGAKRGEQYELDILALNEKEKKALVGECKWQDNVDAKKVISHVQETVQYVKELQDYEVEYAVFARSFKQKTDEGKCFDLRDLERMFGG